MTDQQPIDHDAVKLAACPFCGTVEGLYPTYHDFGGGEPYAIDCVGCGIDFTPREGVDVIAAWNRRASPPVREGEAVAWTAQIIIDDLKTGRITEGWFWPTYDERHPMPLFAHPPQGEAETREKVAELLFWNAEGFYAPHDADCLKLADAILALTGRGKGDE